jgi:hypothetical protein
MSKHISFFLTEHNGIPLVGGSPSVIVYCDMEGNSHTLPVVTEKGNGFYEFVVDYEADGPSAYLIDAGVASAERYLHGSVGESVSFAMYDADGNPDSGATPVFSAYFDSTGPLVPPDIVSLGEGLFAFWTPVGRGKLIRYCVGDGLNTYWGTVGSTTIANADPAGGSDITNTQVLTFDVLDTETELGRVLIGIMYPGMAGATELAWDGTTVCGPFLVTVVPIEGGRRYSVLRTGGWPSAPTVRVFVTNLGGREI